MAVSWAACAAPVFLSGMALTSLRAAVEAWVRKQGVHPRSAGITLVRWSLVTVNNRATVVRAQISTVFLCVLSHFESLADLLLLLLLFGHCSAVFVSVDVSDMGFLCLLGGVDTVTVSNTAGWGCP